MKHILRKIALFAALAAFSLTAAASAEYLDRGMTDDMLDPEYWITTADEKLAMTKTEIAAFNEKILAKLGEGNALVTERDRVRDMAKLPSSYSGSTVASYIKTYSLPTGDRFANGSALTGAKRDAYESNRNLAKLADKVTVKYAVAVRRSCVRAYPTADLVTDSADDLEFDDLQESELYAFEPVAVLHASADGKWFFVLSANTSGWMPASDAAVCASRAEWLKWVAPDSFLVVTDRAISLDDDPYNPEIAGLTLAMGTKIALETPEKVPEYVGSRLSSGYYAAKIPYRTDSGALAVKYSLIAKNGGASEGYLPFTRASVVRQAFKLLGMRYGWGGMYNSTDCSGLVNEVYRVFGFRLPRNAGTIAKLPCDYVAFGGETSAKRYELMKTVPTGSPVYFPGHITLYLGERGGRHYVISSLGSLVPENSTDGKIKRIMSVNVNSLNVRRGSGATWLDSLTVAVVIK